MKKNKFLFLCLLLIAPGVTGCSSEENDNEITGNNEEESKVTVKLCDVSWKLYGFGIDSENIRKAEPSACSTCYLVKFEPDGTFSGQTTSNDFIGIYTTKNKSFKIVEYGTTKVGEVGDGYKFVEAFCSSFQYEITDKGELKLYYTQNDFLLFNPQ